MTMQTIAAERGSRKAAMTRILIRVAVFWALIGGLKLADLALQLS